MSVGGQRAGENMTRQIGFLIYPGFQLLDLTGPLDAFHMARRMSGSEPYKIRVVSPTGGLIGSSSGLEVMSQQVGRKAFDTFFVVGGGVLSACSDPPSELANLARIAGRDARRVASVCTGAFILARAGLLDGRNVTTHWKYAALLQRLFPRVRVDGDRIFVKDGNNGHPPQSIRRMTAHDAQANTSQGWKALAQ